MSNLVAHMDLLVNGTGTLIHPSTIAGCVKTAATAFGATAIVMPFLGRKLPV
jgi:hypothetical protein